MHGAGRSGGDHDVSQVQSRADGQRYPQSPGPASAQRPLHGSASLADRGRRHPLPRAQRAGWARTRGARRSVGGPREGGIVTLPLVVAQDFGGSRLPIHGPGDHPVQPLATNEVLDRMTSAPAPAPAIVEAPEIAIAEVPAYVAPAYVAAEPAASSDDLRPFRKGDLVVYPAHGIG